MIAMEEYLSFFSYIGYMKKTMFFINELACGLIQHKKI